MAGPHESVRVFAASRPSLRALWRSRTGRLAYIHVIAPSDAVVGEAIDVRLQAWDEYERFHPFRETVAVDTTDADATHPNRTSFDGDGPPVGPGDPEQGMTYLSVTFDTPGIQYLTLDHDGSRYVSNPVRVHEDDPAERTLWGDIHLHSQLSDGAGSMARGFQFARETMGLDVCAYTDHDTMGFFIPPRWQRERMHDRYFAEMQATTAAHHDPGAFVTLFGYEWTKQPNRGGHINVYFDDVDDAELFDSHAPATDTYEGLWTALRAYRAREDTGDVLTIPHHPAEAMYPFDFAATDYDDELAPLVEVYSQWGSSERPAGAGNRRPLAMGQGEIDEPGHHVQDALAYGYRVGLIGGSDYHGPYPGHVLLHARPHLPSLAEWRRDGIGWGHIWRVWNEQSYPGGLTAFRASERSRAAVFDALRSRAVYATTQPDRILATLRVNGIRVGEQDSTVHVPSPTTPREIDYEVHGTAPVESVTVVKNGDPHHVATGTADYDAPLETFSVQGQIVDDAPLGDPGDSPVDYYYLRVQQAARPDTPVHVPGGAAWLGPLCVERAERRRLTIRG
ncbi:DUF3604 domain-containing protein [Halosegnis sp.]|uniref:DUF3604 domain-containing protein n=1 Tax=Halosegnis sp. TaxID=2864959 RepID=UPI0035D412CB